MPKSDPTSEDFVVASPVVAGRDFERLVALSCWFILVLEDERDVAAEDAAYMLEEFGCESSKDRAPIRDSEIWQQWRTLGAVESDEEFAELLYGEILPDLLLRFRGTSSPLALLPAALEGLPVSMLRTMLRAALEYDAESTIGAGELPLEEMRNLWNYWQDKCDLNEPRYGAMFSSTLSEFLVSALSPDSDKTVYDFCARDGSALAECAERDVRRLFAVEQNARLAVVASVRLRLNSETRLVVHCGSPLDFPPPSEGYDCVIGNLPWGGKVSSERLRSRFPVTTDSQELLYLQHGLAALKPGGRAAFVVPLGILFRSGAAQQVRELLLREYCVDAVIELPANTFTPATAARGAVLLVRRDAPPKDVWFITSEQFSNAVEHRSYTEDDLDHEILMVALHARKGDMDITTVRSEIDRLAKRAELPESTKDCDPKAAKWLTENSRQMLTLARHFIGGEMPGVEFPELVPIRRLAEKNWELLWKGDQSDGLGKWLKPIEQIPEARIATLGELASDIFVGIPYTSAMTSVNIGGILATPGDGDTSVALVRVSDLSKPKAEGRTLVHTHKALTTGALSSVPERQFLQSGDLLISRSGTVGRTGVYVAKIKAEPSQPSVATNGVIVVRLGDEALAHFLADLIQTAPYQEALQSETTGSVIRHLRTETLRSLRVPVLPRAEMVRLREVIRPGVSGETMLAALESRPGYTVALRYLIDSPEVREFAARPLDEPWSATRTALNELLRKWEPVAQETAGGEQDPFFDWVAGFVRTSGELEEILAFHPGADQFAALQTWRQRLRSSAFRKSYRAVRQKVDSGEAANSALPRAVQKRCEELYDRLTALSQAVANALLAEVRLTATISPAVVAVGKPVELTVTVRNGGPLPLKRVTLDLPGGVEVPRPWPLLPGQMTNQWPLPWTPETSGRKVFQIGWSAVRLDEQPCRGTFELAVEVQSLQPKRSADAFGESPYIYARVLDAESDHMFFGRRAALAKFKAELSKCGPTNILLIEGNRRIGKTSLLGYFARHHLPEDWLPVFINFQDFDGDAGAQAKPGIPTRKVFEGMARALASAVAAALPGEELEGLGTPPPRTSLKFGGWLRTVAACIHEDAPFASFKDFFLSFRERVKPRRLVLFLDEFDRLQEGIESGITSDQVPENLRHLFQSFGDVAGIFTGSRTIRRLRQQYWNVLFGLGETVRLTGLEQAEAESLIEEPVRGRLVYSPDAVRLIAQLTARQPLLIQGMCDRLFQICRERSEQNITVPMVEEVAEERAKDSEHFETLWAYIRSDRQRALVFIVDELERNRGAANFEQIQDLAEDHGLRFTADELEAAMDDLGDLEVIGKTHRDSTANYRLEVPLFGRWLRQNKDLSQYLRAAQEED